MKSHNVIKNTDIFFSTNIDETLLNFTCKLHLHACIYLYTFSNTILTILRTYDNGGYVTREFERLYTIILWHVLHQLVPKVVGPNIRNQYRAVAGSTFVAGCIFDHMTGVLYGGTDLDEA